MNKKTTIQEARELFWELADELGMGNGHLPLVQGFSGRVNDPFPKLVGSANIVTQPVEQQMRHYAGYPDDERVPLEERMGVVALHAWLTWPVQKDPHRTHLLFATSEYSEEESWHA